MSLLGCDREGREVSSGGRQAVRQLAGRFVRHVWVQWAAEQSDPKPSWLARWDELDDGQREVDMRIGEALFDAGRSTGGPAGGAGCDDIAAGVLRTALDDGPDRTGHHPALQRATGDRWLAFCPACTEATGRWVGECRLAQPAVGWPPQLLAAPGTPSPGVVDRKVAEVLDLLAEDAEDGGQLRTAGWLRMHRDIYRGTFHADCAGPAEPDAEPEPPAGVEDDDGRAAS